MKYLWIGTGRNLSPTSGMLFCLNHLLHTMLASLWQVLCWLYAP